MFSQTIAALEKFDNPHDFERLCADILNAQGYKDVVPIAPRGGSDGGMDITFTMKSSGKGLAWAISPDGQTLATGGGFLNDSIKIWNMHTGELTGNLTLPLESVSSFAINPRLQNILGNCSGPQGTYQTTPNLVK